MKGSVFPFILSLFCIALPLRGFAMLSAGDCAPVVRPANEMPYVIIVDPVATGNMSARVFIKRGYRVIHLLSRPISSHDIGSYRREDCRDSSGEYLEKLHDGNLEDTLHWLKRFHPIQAVLPGTDSGVELADAIGNALHLPSNTATTSTLRREKDLMSAAVRASVAMRAKGYRAIRERMSGTLEDLLRWQREEYRRWPVIVKPQRGAGSQGVRACYNEAEVKEAFAAIHGKPNVMGEIVNNVLIQEFLGSDLRSNLYIVDMTTANGVHRVTHIYKYTLIPVVGGAYINDRVEMLPNRGHVQDVLVDYAKMMNDELHVRIGSSHYEIFMEPDGDGVVEDPALRVFADKPIAVGTEPVFIDLGPRVGGMIPLLSADATGGVFNQLELNANAYLDPERAFDGLPPEYTLQKFALNVFLNVSSEGKAEDRAMEELIRHLPSYYEHRFYHQIGESLPRTIDLQTARGYVFLLNADREQLMRDYYAIRAAERAQGYIH